ncbi:MAG: D-alanine aminotransferase [SAR86 cluster bacterium]|jgi:D-alanine transaminase|uniref:Aminodeoxychorismate lyase n=1 Tax=SAR86 cluster bacterium TaxID=2030880 RepID=A0A520MVR7_9GAMM|nr:MAG: D-alanine aminotransferase [SAR86 cluster bacterium]|tara:strand:+ start:1009 stop:1836 length:828 start_codon:yes stop_codon:yes gene_type:complete
MENIHAVYNGRFNFLNDIKISPLSRAYTFSDSVYEVIPFCNSNIIAFDKHITRLKNSCDSLSFKADVKKISSEILDLINKSNHANGYVYYQVSRGIDPIRSHMFDDSISLETFGYVVEHNFISKSLTVMICEDMRWQRCDIKSTSLLGNVLSMNNARNNGCDEVIMHKNNLITEGGASNVFFANDDCVFTPSLSNNILPGITRELLIEEIKQAGIKIEEGQFDVDDLLRAKSIWLTSSTKGLAQVKEVSGKKTNLVNDHQLFKACEEIFVKNFLS